MPSHETLKIEDREYEVLERFNVHKQPGFVNNLYKAKTPDGRMVLIKDTNGNTKRQRYIQDSIDIQKKFNVQLSQLPIQHPIQWAPPFLVNEWIDGDDLLEFNTTHPDFYILKIRDITKALVNIVCALGAIGLSHRDIKSKNLVIGTFEETNKHSPTQTRLIDFEALAEFGKPKRDGIPGTPLYAAPETLTMLLGDISAATDIYSIGIVILDLLLEKFPHIDHSFLTGFNDQTHLLQLKRSNKFLHQERKEKIKAELRKYVPEAFWQDMRTLVDFAFTCAAHDPAKRPTDETELLQRLYHTGDLRQL